MGVMTGKFWDYHHKVLFLMYCISASKILKLFFFFFLNILPAVGVTIPAVCVVLDGGGGTLNVSSVLCPHPHLILTSDRVLSAPSPDHLHSHAQ